MSALQAFLVGDSFPQITGQALLDASSAVGSYGDTVKSGDLLAVNFDRRDVHTGGGLYLLVEREAGRVTWRGCRTMARNPHGIGIRDAQGNWETVPSLPSHLHVMGLIENVYRPT